MAREIKSKNLLLLASQRFWSWRPVTVLVAPFVHHVDTFFLRLSGGHWDVARLAGLPVVEVTAVGAKSGQSRTLPLAGIPDGDKFVLIASNFGRERTPAWYYNLKANPECMVKSKGQVGTYIAREAEGEERQRYWDLAVSCYLGFEVYKQRAAHRKIPVMVLEPKA